MINTLKMSLKIDMTYTINSFIYNIKRLPILKDLFPDDSLYKSKKAKKVVRVFGVVFSIIKMSLIKLLYFLMIYAIAEYISDKNTVNSFIHIYFIFTIIGMFINNKILRTSTKKYFSVILFNMDTKKFIKANLFSDIIYNFILNIIFLLVIIKSPIAIVLAIFTGMSRVIGEMLNIMYYKRYNMVLIANYTLYWAILLSFLVISLLPLINITVSNIIIVIVSIIFLPLSLGAYKYISGVADYKIIYKKLNSENMVMNSKQSSEYSRQAMVEVRDKDKIINSKKLKNKKGYDLFNTIFFERHREILMRSAKNYAAIAMGVLIIFIVLILNSNSIKNNVNDFLLNRLSWFVIVMYFINRGAIVTQAMFYNCDHAMLTFNFYKEPKVILNVFKKRVVTLIKINLIPAIVIAIGLVVMLYLSGGTTNIVNYFTIPIFILSLSVFFSVHYLVIYYLFQPYNKNMQMRSVTYSIVSLLTYILSYSLTNLSCSSLVFSIGGVVLTVTYIILALVIVYKEAPTTFRIR